MTAMDTGPPCCTASSHMAGVTSSFDVAEVPLELAAVFCDRGRIRTSWGNQGLGVHGPHWRETKDGAFHRMQSCSLDGDAQPNVPECFRSQAYVENAVNGLKNLGQGGREETEPPERGSSAEEGLGDTLPPPGTARDQFAGRVASQNDQPAAERGGGILERRPVRRGDPSTASRGAQRRRPAASLCPRPPNLAILPKIPLPSPRLRSLGTTNVLLRPSACRCWRGPALAGFAVAAREGRGGSTWRPSSTAAPYPVRVRDETWLRLNAMEPG